MPFSGILGQMWGISHLLLYGLTLCCAWLLSSDLSLLLLIAKLSAGKCFQLSKLNGHFVPQVHLKSFPQTPPADEGRQLVVGLGFGLG